MCRGTHQRTGPGVWEMAYPVLGDIEAVEGLETVQHAEWEINQVVIGHVQLLKPAQPNPVSACRTERQREKQ